MGSRVQQRALGGGSGAAPVRHLYEGSRIDPPTRDTVALCGYAGGAPTSVHGRVVSSVRPEHCVVCLDIARGKGYGV